MLFSIPLYSREKMSQVGTVVVSCYSHSEFIKVGDGPINYFSEFPTFAKINSKPLIYSPIFPEYLSGNCQSRLS